MSRTGGGQLYWIGRVPPAPAGVLVFVHGVGEHCGRYHHVLDYFAARAFSCFAFDLRGHGRSSGQRGQVGTFDEYDDDLATVMAHVATVAPEPRPVLVGHSMGGLIALRHTLLHPGAQSATILSSPALGLSGISATPFFQWLVKLFGAWKPRYGLPSGLGTKWLSRTPGVERAYLDDPLVTGRLTPSWFGAFVEAVRDAHERAPSLVTPLLLMQSGADKIVDSKWARRWVERAPESLVTLHVWEGFYHEMFNEPEREEVFELMLDWIANRRTVGAASGL